MAGVAEADEKVMVSATIAAEAVAMSNEMAGALELATAHHNTPLLPGLLDADTRARLYQELNSDFAQLEGLFGKSDQLLAGVSVAAREQAAQHSKAMDAQAQQVTMQRQTPCHATADIKRTLLCAALCNRV